MNYIAPDAAAGPKGPDLRLLAKLGAENRAQAGVRALARGVVSPEDLGAQ